MVSIVLHADVCCCRLLRCRRAAWRSAAAGRMGVQAADTARLASTVTTHSGNTLSLLLLLISACLIAHQFIE